MRKVVNGESVCENIQMICKNIGDWCREMNFGILKKIKNFNASRIFDRSLNLVPEIKYLGVI